MRLRASLQRGTESYEHLPEAAQKIVYDKYHIAAHLSKAVDQVRRAENKRLRELILARQKVAAVAGAVGWPM